MGKQVAMFRGSRGNSKTLFGHAVFARILVKVVLQIRYLVMSRDIRVLALTC